MITVFREAESKAESRRNQGRFRVDSPERFRLGSEPRVGARRGPLVGPARRAAPYMAAVMMSFVAPQAASDPFHQSISFGSSQMAMISFISTPAPSMVT